ncbi:MAG: sigma-70 family RNA polymerase sigma factor [Saprospiraceae bacterium]|nr:sigma-70 family RNA polymerase sigma factor [Saprospiraceae bacterium]
MTNSELIVACRTQDRKAQQMLFDRFSPKMMGVCRRYLKTQEDAEDVLIEAFYKVFNNLPQFKAQGSFEGWIRRIVVNECLMFLRRKHNFNLTVEIDQNLDVKTTVSTQDQLEADDILALLERLPTGYRTVFNLYVLEGYKHREIAEILGISINTSKSQLILAKKKLQQLLKQINYPGVHQEGAG